MANRAERAAIELAEAVILSGRVGDVFDAVVIDETDRGAQIQLADLPIIASVQAHRIDPGDDLRVARRSGRRDCPQDRVHTSQLTRPDAATVHSQSIQPAQDPATLTGNAAGWVRARQRCIPSHSSRVSGRAM